MEMRTEFGERLYEARKKAKLTQAQLAERVGLGQSTVAEMEKTALGSSHVAALAEALGVNVHWLSRGDGPAKLAPKLIDSEARRPQDVPLKHLPVVGAAQLGDNGNYCELEYPVGFGDGSIAWPSRDPGAYALRCKGESMRPRIKHGEFVIVEPSHANVAGDEVLVRAKDGRVMVKELHHVRDGMVYLDSINQNHRQIAIPVDEIETMHHVAGIAKNALWRTE